MIPGVVKADLHIHTCLSPCGDMDMYPKQIVETAKERNLSLIAVCDHNTAGNAHAVIEAAVGTGLLVLPGLEICTREEVHILGIFPTHEEAMKISNRCLETVHQMNRPELFGDRFLSWLTERSPVSKIRP